MRLLMFDGEMLRLRVSNIPRTDGAWQYEHMSS
jgi:hypothetical protein